MRIEKISDDQIKCILTKEDLDARKINFSELTFGSAQANVLLRDMMQQASCEFGFEADDKPLMIEVVPMQSGIIVLVITSGISLRRIYWSVVSNNVCASFSVISDTANIR